jgi:hypothetical protein
VPPDDGNLMYGAEILKDPSKIVLIHLILFISGRNFEAELLRLDILDVLVFLINLGVEMTLPGDIKSQQDKHD